MSVRLAAPTQRRQHFFRLISLREPRFWRQRGLSFRIELRAESSRELQTEARAVERLRIQLYLCPDPIRDLLDDREAESAAVSARLRAAPEALKNVMAMLRRDPRALIVDGQYSRRTQCQRDGSPALGIQDRVLQDVAHDCLDQSRGASHVDCGGL